MAAAIQNSSTCTTAHHHITETTMFITGDLSSHNYGGKFAHVDIDKLLRICLPYADEMDRDACFQTAEVMNLPHDGLP